MHAPADALVVMDAGIATETTWPGARQRLPLSSRQRTRRFDPEQSIPSRPGRTTFICQDRGEVRLYCYSEEPPKRRKGSPDASPSASRASCESSTRGCPRADSVWQRRADQRCRGAGQHYTVDVVAQRQGSGPPGSTSPLPAPCSPIPVTVTLQCPRLGSTDLRTYTMLTDLEAVFRSLKSELGLRPSFHKTQNRSDGHLFITVIAYPGPDHPQTPRRERQLDHSASYPPRPAPCHRILPPKGRPHVRKATRAEQPQLKIYTALDLHPAPGGVTKLIV